MQGWQCSSRRRSGDHPPSDHPAHGRLARVVNQSTLTQDPPAPSSQARHGWRQPPSAHCSLRCCCTWTTSQARQGAAAEGRAGGHQERLSCAAARGVQRCGRAVGQRQRHGVFCGVGGGSPGWFCRALHSPWSGAPRALLALPLAAVRGCSPSLWHAAVEFEGGRTAGGKTQQRQPPPHAHPPPTPWRADPLPQAPPGQNIEAPFVAVAKSVYKSYLEKTATYLDACQNY